ncbi:MAG: hypothetical protein RR141_00865 [Rikenellaceae bacterium]
MRKILYTPFIVISLLLALFSCKKDNIDIPPDGTVGGDYRAPKSVADNSTINLATVMIGAIPEKYQAGFASRFKNVVTLTDAAKIVVVSSSSMVASTSEIMKVYNNNGVVVVVDPDKTTVNDWFKKQGIDLELTDYVNENAIFSFCKRLDTYILYDTPKDKDVNESLNQFVAWVNGGHNHSSDLNDYESKDIKVLFPAQQLQHSHSYRINEIVAHVILSDPDYIDGNGQVDVRYVVYPLYVFNSESDNGDYYIVKAIMTVHNVGMYRGNYNKTHGIVMSHLCGHYLKQLNADFNLVKSTDVNNHVGEFPMTGLPTPKTTLGKTEYSNGVSLNVGGSITGGVSESDKDTGIAASINGGVSFSEEESHVMSDIDIKNNSVGNKVSYEFIVNNLPHYSVNISITDPPLVAISNVEFTASWIWRVPTTKDYDKSESFSIVANIQPIYANAHFFTTGADFSENVYRDLCGKKHVIPLKRPNRTPTGFIKIKNTFNSEVVTGIKIWNVKDQGSNPYFVSSKQFIPSETFIGNLPIGTYKVEFKAGPNATNVKTYELNRNIGITRGDETALSSTFDFVVKK